MQGCGGCSVQVVGSIINPGTVILATAVITTLLSFIPRKKGKK